MSNTTSQKNTKASTFKPIVGKPPPGDKTLGVDPDIRLYKVEVSDKTE